MWAVIIGFFAGFIRRFLAKKEQGEKAIETVISEREAALDNVKKANDTRARIERDDAYADVIRMHFERRDSD